MWNLSKIPKIAHFYWGGANISFLRYISILSFQKMNPEWKINFYIPDKQTKNEFTWNTWEHKELKKDVKDYFNILKDKINPIIINMQKLNISDDLSDVYKSDLLRNKVLSDFGGVWCDFDIIFFKSMEYLNFNNKNYKNIDGAVCIQFNTHHIGFLFSSINNLYFFDNKTSLPMFIDKRNYQSLGVSFYNKYYPTIKSIQDKYNLIFHNIDMEVVYPHNCQTIKRVYRDKGFEYLLTNNNSIGIHWYGGHKDSMKLNSELTHENIKSYNVTLTNLIRYIFKDNYI